MGLYCSKQIETTFNHLGKKSLHITFKFDTTVNIRRKTQQKVIDVYSKI